MIQHSHASHATHIALNAPVLAIHSVQHVKLVTFSSQVQQLASILALLVISQIQQTMLVLSVILYALSAPDRATHSAKHVNLATFFKWVPLSVWTIVHLHTLQIQSIISVSSAMLHVPNAQDHQALNALPAVLVIFCNLVAPPVKTHVQRGTIGIRPSTHVQVNLFLNFLLKK